MTDKEMRAHELFVAASDAEDSGEQRKALELYQKAARLGDLQMRAVTAAQLTRSDDVAQPPCTEIKERSRFQIVETAERPDYVFGNALRVLVDAGDISESVLQIDLERLESREWPAAFDSHVWPHVQAYGVGSPRPAPPSLEVEPF